jgi:hypothetical protein
MTLTLTSLDTGWEMDDYVHRLLLGTDHFFAQATHPLDIFSFGKGGTEVRSRMIEYGFLPWWTSPEWKIAFWRPISAITHWVDYQMWPTDAPLMHLHSVFWYGALILVLFLFYRRVEEHRWLAGLAVLLYALHSGHGPAVGWLANRNILVSAVLGVSALVAHLRWRQERRRSAMLVGWVLFALALLANEGGIAVMAYLISYALFVDTATRSGRVLSLVPYAVIVILWRAVFTLSGYGVAGTDIYTDPLREPIRFAEAAAERLPILLQAQWTGVPADLAYFLTPRGSAILAAVGAALLLLLTILLIPRLRRDRVARFWGLGMILAVVPCAATVPSGRLLFFVGIGTMGLMARVIGILIDHRSIEKYKSARRVSSYVVAWTMLFIHLILPLFVLPARADQPFGPPEKMRQYYFEPGDPDAVSNKVVVVVNAPSILHAAESWPRLLTNGRPVYERMLVLSSVSAPVQLTKIDDRTISIWSADGLCDGMFQGLFRSRTEPFVVGEELSAADVNIEVTSISEDGRVLEAQFTFPAPLGGQSFYWIQFTPQGYQPFVLPATGESLSTSRAPSLL